MEQIIKQLYEIEVAAVGIMENTMEKKRELAESTEEKIIKFDKNLQEETNKKLAVYSKELNQESAVKLKQLEEHTDEIKKSMEEIYNNYHKDIARYLLDAVLKE